MWKRTHVLRKPEGGDAGAGGGGGAAAPAAAPAAPSPAPAAPAPSPAAASPAAAPAAAAPAASAPAAAPAAGAPAAAPAVAGIWPENWRETVSKDDAKKLAQLQRYGSPEAAMQALFAAQERIRSGELLPKLGKNPSAEELKTWREAHGVPDKADGYLSAKDVKIDEGDKPFFEVLAHAAFESNVTPDQFRRQVEAFNEIKKASIEHQQQADAQAKQASEDALRAEWGGEFRRNINLVHGLFDGAGSQGLKDKFLAGRLADGTPIGSSPEAMKMLLGLALINNPGGVVVPGGGGEHGEGIKGELEKLQAIPAAKKTEAQSKREVDLIDAALKAGFMDGNGAWKK